MSATAEKGLALPQYLAIRRSLDPTCGFFYAETAEGEWLPVPVATQTINTTHSSAAAAEQARNAEPGEVAANAGRGNIQGVEFAITPAETERLVVRASLQIHANACTPSMCSDPEVVAFLEDWVAAYQALRGFRHLAERIAGNILCGRWLWRHARSPGLAVTVRAGGKEATFQPEPGNFEISQFAEQWREVGHIARVIETGLIDPSQPQQIEMTASALSAPGAQCFPSTDLITRDAARVRSSVRLSSITTREGVRQAIFQARKIGNALRTIDTWYGEEGARAIAVEPLGADRGGCRAWRLEAGNDLYTLLGKRGHTLLEQLQAAEHVDELPGDIHFISACLLRGGSFSRAAKNAEG